MLKQVFLAHFQPTVTGFALVRLFAAFFQFLVGRGGKVKQEEKEVVVEVEVGVDEGKVKEEVQQKVT